MICFVFFLTLFAFSSSFAETTSFLHDTEVSFYVLLKLFLDADYCKCDRISQDAGFHLQKMI